MNTKLLALILSLIFSFNYSQQKKKSTKPTQVKLKTLKPVEERSWIGYYEPDVTTGDFDCGNIIPKYDNAIENELSVTNKGNTDVVVKIMDLQTDIAIRIVYIKEGEQISIKNIPQGKYYLKEAYGKAWKQMKIERNCIGEFSQNAIYKKGKNIADFNIKKTITSTHEEFQIPSYSLEIGVTFSNSKSGNHITETITSAEFNK